jgi:hypothetical protein
VDLENLFGPLWKVGGYNSKARFEDNEDPKKELKEELEKEQPSSNVIIPSQTLFKMEVKVEIETYQGDLAFVYLNHWLQ